MTARIQILSQLREALCELGIRPGAEKGVLLACSGGADSMALLHLLHALERESDAAGWLAVAHLNHSLRGEAGGEDAAFVEGWCDRLEVPCHVETLPAGSLERGGRSVEELAREARYDFLTRIAQERNCSSLLTAHTLEDAAETLLLRLLRGSGRTGLCGLRRARRIAPGLELVRPAVGISGKLLRAFLAEEGLPHREDASNQDPRFDRNRLRSDVIPVLERFSPGFVDRLAWTSQLLSDEEEFLRQEAGALADRIARQVQGRSIVLNLKELRGVSRVFRYRVLREALLRSRGDLRGLTRFHIQQLEGLVHSGEGAVDLPGGWRGEIGRKGLELGPIDPSEALGPGFCYEFAVPGRVDTVSGYRLAATYETVVPSRETIHRSAPRIAWLDAAALGSELKIRSWRPGDRMLPLGMDGRSRKVQDLLTDKKIPGRERGGIPLLEASGEIAWVGGLAVASPYRIRAETRQAVRIEIEQVPNDIDWLNPHPEG